MATPPDRTLPDPDPPKLRIPRANPEDAMFRLHATALCLLPVAAPAQTPPEIIAAQIDAFRAADFDTAFTFASDNIRAAFGDAARFGAMVAQGYPMVLDPAETRFLDRFTRVGVTFQRVLMTDRSGGVFLLEYRFAGDGDSLRIDGVRILPRTGAGV